MPLAAAFYRSDTQPPMAHALRTRAWVPDINHLARHPLTVTLGWPWPDPKATAVMPSQIWISARDSSPGWIERHAHTVFSLS